MKKLLLGTTIAALSIVSLGAGIASAAEHGGGRCHQGELFFNQLDIDGNGVITAEDLSAKAMIRFNKGDADGDGFLSPEEVLAAGQARWEARSGGDESAEHAERRAARAQQMMEDIFAQKDANDDGLLSPDELKSARLEDRFTQADTDANGEVSEAEFDAAKAADQGGAADSNGDMGPRDCGNG